MGRPSSDAPTEPKRSTGSRHLVAISTFLTCVVEISRVWPASRSVRLHPYPASPETGRASETQRPPSPWNAKSFWTTSQLLAHRNFIFCKHNDLFISHQFTGYTIHVNPSKNNVNANAYGRRFEFRIRKPASVTFAYRFGIVLRFGACSLAACSQARATTGDVRVMMPNADKTVSSGHIEWKWLLSTSWSVAVRRRVFVSSYAHAWYKASAHIGAAHAAHAARRVWTN